MYENVITHQFNSYVKSKGLDPDTLTITERDEQMVEMRNDLYPGGIILSRNNAPSSKWSSLTKISGLEKAPKFLSDSMLPNVPAEVTAEASVLANGGYDPCQYAVNNFKDYPNYENA